MAELKDVLAQGDMRTTGKADQLFTVFNTYYQQSQSNIVKAFSLNALVSLARNDAAKLKVVKTLLKHAMETGSPSVRSRAKALSKDFSL